MALAEKAAAGTDEDKDTIVDDKNMEKVAPTAAPIPPPTVLSDPVSDGRAIDPAAETETEDMGDFIRLARVDAKRG
jgi:hypothetical protein